MTPFLLNSKTAFCDDVCCVLPQTPQFSKLSINSYSIRQRLGRAVIAAPLVTNIKAKISKRTSVLVNYYTLLNLNNEKKEQNADSLHIGLHHRKLNILQKFQNDSTLNAINLRSMHLHDAEYIELIK